MSIQASVSINLHDIIGEVHPHLYGANLEHIGQSVYGGHWAEMLKSRKFAGHDGMYVGLSEGLSHQNPSFGIVAPWEAVNPDDERVLFVHDNTTYYTGVQSQRITIRQDDGREHGIQQSRLYLEAGRAYDLRLVLCRQGQTVHVHLGDQVWTIAVVPQTWTMYTKTLIPQQTKVDGAPSITLEQEGNLRFHSRSTSGTPMSPANRPTSSRMTASPTLYTQVRSSTATGIAPVA